MQTASKSIAKKHWLASRLPFFYGWVIVPISILGTLATSPGQTYMVSIFNPSFRDTFDLSLSELTGAYMVGTILASIPQSYIGTWMDRLGFRRMLLIIASIFGLACMFIAEVRNIWMLLIAFFLLRTFGQGALELLSSNMLAMWFRKRLGSITGFSGVIVSVMIGLVPVIVLRFINDIGWRNTYRLAGLAVWLLILPLALFIYITRPEEIGQVVDGEVADPNEQSASPFAAEVNLTLKQTMRTRSFWIGTSMAIAWAAIGTGLTFNLLPIFTGKGLTEEQAAGMFTILMGISAVTRILGGYLADRIPLNRLMLIAQVFYVAAIAALMSLPTAYLVAGYTILLGISQGMFNGWFNTLWVRYFGRQNLGKVRGAVWTATVAGSSTGPFFMGVAYDQFGDFQLALLGCGIIMFLLGIASFWATQPAQTSYA